MNRGLIIYFLRVNHRHPPIRTTITCELKNPVWNRLCRVKKQNPCQNPGDNSRFTIQKISVTCPLTAKIIIQIPIGLTI